MVGETIVRIKVLFSFILGRSVGEEQELQITTPSPLGNCAMPNAQCPIVQCPMGISNYSRLATNIYECKKEITKNSSDKSQFLTTKPGGLYACIINGKKGDELQS